MHTLKAIYIYTRKLRRRRCRTPGISQAHNRWQSSVSGWTVVLGRASWTPTWQAADMASCARLKQTRALVEQKAVGKFFYVYVYDVHIVFFSGLLIIIYQVGNSKGPALGGRWLAARSRFSLELTPFFLITWTFQPSMALAMAVTMRASANMIQRSRRQKNKRKCFSLLKSETALSIPGCRAPSRITSGGACAGAPSSPWQQLAVRSSSSASSFRLSPAAQTGCSLWVLDYSLCCACDAVVAAAAAVGMLQEAFFDLE